ncbi:MAG TPA: DNA translocase FtsK 4TM domain-containing protein [Candidatus Kryptonia bacterium]|nr:DNA translocase FtsK 4TM domain-containing protein [Candidatus Kryptonia bacterium]
MARERAEAAVTVAATTPKRDAAGGDTPVRRRKPAPAAVETSAAVRVLDEVVAVVALSAAVFALVSFLSYQRGAIGSNLGGPVGYGLANNMLQALGLAAYLGPILVLVIAAALFRQAAETLQVSRVAGGIALVGILAVALGLLRPDRDVAVAGGWIGGFIAAVLQETFGVGGATVLTACLLLLAFVFTTSVSLRSAAAGIARGGRAGWTGLTSGWARWTARRANRAGTTLERPNVKHEPSPGATPVIVLKDEVVEDEPTVVDPHEPVVVAPAPLLKPAEKPARSVKQEELRFTADGHYQVPSSMFLDQPPRSGVRVDEEALRKSSQILETKLADFGIQGKVTAVRPGPVINTFEIEPAPGVKVNRIVTLADDLAMALRAVGVRILAPVPGTAVVGIEVANARREQISLKELIDSEPYGAAESPLTLALGKDTAGNPTVADLARMPHLLVAGATGTGKSVSLNAMIMSILHKASPRDVRFIMIDLKMLELSVYEDIPHLLVPVVTDPKKAVVVLKNLCEQMDERYRVMKGLGVRNIDGYNRIVDREEHERKAGVIELKDVVDGDDEGDDAPPAPVREHLPKIVVIIDELADLMMTVGRNVEEPITRLAQKARAAGIHLILATQRPSVDVITGLIKANFPARISFQVTARVDSRTILDHIGAERLLGGGDMLYLPPGTARVQRLHGAYVSEDEIRKVVDFIKRQGSPLYAFGLLESDEEEAGDAGEPDELEDVMYDQAVRLVTESRQASISWVQRRLRIGYNRAARMIERMEREGVITASEGGRPREVIARRIDGDS